MNAELVQPKDLVVTDGGVFRLEHGRRYPDRRALPPAR